MMTETKFLQMSKYDQRSGLILALLSQSSESRLPFHPVSISEIKLPIHEHSQDIIARQNQNWKIYIFIKFLLPIRFHLHHYLTLASIVCVSLC